MKGIALLLDRQSASSSTVDESKRARLTALVEVHFERIWRLLRRWGLPASDADDATQQVFMIAIRKIDRITPEAEGAFLYGTALRVAANARRSARRHAPAPDRDERSAARTAPPDRAVEVNEALVLLDEILALMPAELGRVLVLAEVEQLAVPEIAQLEAIPTGTAASRLRRARTVFREHLQQAQSRNPFGGPADDS